MLNVHLQKDRGLWKNDNLLSPQEEKRLFQKLEINPGDKKTREEIIERNTGLVHSVAEKIKNLYSFFGLELEDLYQEGRIGLMKAIDKFDWKKGYKFSTYAIPWIRQSVTRFIGNQARTIRVPISEITKIVRYKRAERKLFQELKRSPTTQEIAKKMKIGVSEVRFLEEIKKKTSSLEEPLRPGNGDDGDNSLINVIKDEKTDSPLLRVEKEDLKERVRESLSYLNPREKKILMMRFGLEDGIRHTLEEVGKVFSITKERIRQIQKKALGKLKMNPRLKELLR